MLLCKLCLFYESYFICNLRFYVCICDIDIPQVHLMNDHQIIFCTLIMYWTLIDYNQIRLFLNFFIVSFFIFRENVHQHQCNFHQKTRQNTTIQLEKYIILWYLALCYIFCVSVLNQLNLWVNFHKRRKILDSQLLINYITLLNVTLETSLC